MLFRSLFSPPPTPHHHHHHPPTHPHPHPLPPLLPGQDLSPCYLDRLSPLLPGQAADDRHIAVIIHRGADVHGDGPHRLEIVGGGDGESSLNDVHTWVGGWVGGGRGWGVTKSPVVGWETGANPGCSSSSSSRR